MLHWMHGQARQDKIRNKYIREKVGVAPMLKKMVESRLGGLSSVEKIC